MAKIKAKEMLKKLKVKFKDGMYDIKLEKKLLGPGKKKKEILVYWLNVKKEVFKDFVKELCNIQFPMLSVVSGRDYGEEIELIYHFYVNGGARFEEEGIYVSVFLPKKNPVLPTITDIIPGALITEMEKQEMFGINIEGIPNENFFLSKNHPKGDYPWRRDHWDNNQEK